jgi:uncharacterized protein (DUF1684 family)
MAQSDNSSIGSSVSATDEAAVRAIIDRQTDAWNKHDMAAFVADTMPDVDWINVVGMHWKSRETVLNAHAFLHKGMFANSHMLTMITVRLPPPLLPGGISGSTSPRSSSVRSLGYRNLLRS